MRSKGKKKSAVVPVMCVILAALAVLIVALVVQRGGNPADSGEENKEEIVNTGNTDGSETETPDNTVNDAGTSDDAIDSDVESSGNTGNDEVTPNDNWQVEDGAEVIDINTPFCDLHYSAEWKDYLEVNNVDGDPYAVEFFAVLEEKGKIPLFDVLFGNQDNSSGVIVSNGAEVYVGVKFHEVDFDDTWTDEECNIVYAMQEASNEMMERLNLSDPSETDGDVVVETPYCSLSYPGDWGDMLKIEHRDEDVYAVDFFGQIEGKEKILLFTVIFGGDEGSLLGTIKDGDGNDISVNITFNDIEFDNSWTEVEKNRIYAMQEDANYLMDELALDR